MPRHPKLFIAVDTTQPTQVEAMIALAATRPGQVGVKIGLEAFYGLDTAWLRERLSGVDLFLDLKLHDIPNTVAKGLGSLMAKMSPRIITVHASGGAHMLANAARVQQDDDTERGVLDIAGVTVLTSLGQDDLDIFGATTAQAKVLELAGVVSASGCRALVCSGQEVSAVKAAFPALWTIVPGIRLAGDDAGDQQRVLTPGRAIAQGADSLVVGRSITGAVDPAFALDQVLSEMTPQAHVAKADD